MTHHHPMQNLNSIDPAEVAIRAYMKSDVGITNYTGDRMFLSLQDINNSATSEVWDQLTTMHSQLNQYQTQFAQAQDQLAQFQTQLNSTQANAFTPSDLGRQIGLSNNLQSLQQLLGIVTPPKITISDTEPTSISAKHIWVETTSTGLTKGVWCMSTDGRWMTLQPIYSSFNTGTIAVLTNTQTPANLPAGCSSLYLSSFQAAIHIVSKLGTLLGFNILPQYIEPSGTVKNFTGVSPIGTVSMAAGSTHTVTLNLDSTLSFSSIAAFNVSNGPIAGIPGSIRVNGSFAYYGIRG